MCIYLIIILIFLGDIVKTEKCNAGFADNFRENKSKIKAKTRELCFALNHTPPGNVSAKNKIISLLLPNAKNEIEIMPPFYCDFGTNCYIENNSFIGYNACFCDYDKIIIGSGCYIGPCCSIYTFGFVPENHGGAVSKPVEIENDVYVCGDVKIMPGVKIGKGSVICAGSVVFGDIPSGVVAAGNPCVPVGKVK